MFSTSRRSTWHAITFLLQHACEENDAVCLNRSALSLLASARPQTGLNCRSHIGDPRGKRGKEKVRCWKKFSRLTASLQIIWDEAVERLATAEKQSGCQRRGRSHTLIKSASWFAIREQPTFTTASGASGCHKSLERNLAHARTNVRKG